MNRLTLKEAISHAKEVAEKNYRQGMLCHANPNDEKLDKYIECGREHEQLAGWLEELQRYKGLEEQLEKLYGGKMPLDEVVENLNRVIQNGEEKLDYARILTNAEAEKWDKWKELEKQGRLIELPCLPDEEVWISNKRFGTHKTMYASRGAIVDTIEAGYAIGYTQEEAETKFKEIEGAE